MYNYEDYEDFEYIKSIIPWDGILEYQDKYVNESIDEYDRTHFHYICNSNFDKLEVIKYCIENGADLNIKDIDGKTPFFYICYIDAKKEVLEYCLENGADLNVVSENSSTPFYFICENSKHLIPICKPYMEEYDFIKTLKECNLNWKLY